MSPSTQGPLWHLPSSFLHPLFLAALAFGGTGGSQSARVKGDNGASTCKIALPQITKATRTVTSQQSPPLLELPRPRPAIMMESLHSWFEDDPMYVCRAPHMLMARTPCLRKNLCLQ
jgi:hypothetical protein